MHRLNAAAFTSRHIEQFTTRWRCSTSNERWSMAEPVAPTEELVRGYRCRSFSRQSVGLPLIALIVKENYHPLKCFKMVGVGVF